MKSNCLTGICLGDKAIVKIQGTLKEGIITMISLKGINIQNEEGISFYKWCHVFNIESALQRQLTAYEETLQFYANSNHFDCACFGSVPDKDAAAKQERYAKKTLNVAKTGKKCDDQ